ncbi:hypothetical protein X566_23195 [Afipia sp. P52-10]|nr:hypothetical protein X566_23195 [Afipia sp. P52-10]
MANSQGEIRRGCDLFAIAAMIEQTACAASTRP